MGPAVPPGAPPAVAKGYRETFGFKVDVATRRAVRDLARPFVTPPLGAFELRARVVSTSVDEVLGGVRSGAAALPNLQQELSALRARGLARGPGSTYLASFDLDPRHLELLYCLVRLLRPERVVETGVANGASSGVILRALAAQGSGRLDSFDVSSDVGSLVDDSLRDRWSLHALPAGGRARALRAQIESLGTSDLFLHDSEHTYRWQSMEYNLGWRHLRSGGVLASDDVDASYAFLDFCEAHDLAPWIAVSARKVFGYVVKP